jgi:hypothetical protein
LPGKPLHVGPGERLTLSVGGGVGVDTWTAVRVPAGVTDGVGAVTLASEAARPISFPVPAPGSWSVQVTLQFAGGLGSATYYWRIDVG